MRIDNNVETAMRKEIDELSTMTVGQLRQKYVGVFGEESRSNHKKALVYRLDLDAMMRAMAESLCVAPVSATPGTRRLGTRIID